MMDEPARRRILLIDDDEQLREVYREWLVRDGYDVDTAANGSSGLRVFSECAYDLVITDIVMPDKEGLELIQQMIRMRPRIRIIAISGGGHVGPTMYLTLAKTFGAVSIFEKPIEMKLFREEVRRVLESE